MLEKWKSINKRGKENGKLKRTNKNFKNKK